MIKLSGFAECRSIARCRVQLGDPSRDVYEYVIYSFLKHGDFDLEQYAVANSSGLEPARIISRQADLLELGGQYELALNDQIEGASVFCLSASMSQGQYRARMKATGEHEAGYWTGVFVDVTADKPLPLDAGAMYWLKIVGGQPGQ